MRLLVRSNDVVATRLEELAGVEALALLILASLDVLADALGEDELQVGVDVDLGDAQGDGLLDLILGDAGTTVQNEGQVAGLSLDLAQTLEGKASPVGGIHAVDVADAAGEEVDAQVSNLLALRRGQRARRWRSRRPRCRRCRRPRPRWTCPWSGQAQRASLVRSRLSWKVSS